MSSTYNILMYSHDTWGLGHIRRTMAIAHHILDPKVNVLILTGSPIVAAMMSWRMVIAWRTSTRMECGI